MPGDYASPDYASIDYSTGGGAGVGLSLFWLAGMGDSSMFRATAGKVTMLAIDTATNSPKAGDAANLTGYVSKDDGAVAALADASAAEKDATNAPGLYDFDVSAAEATADKLVFSGKSSTSGVRVVPQVVYTRPAAFTQANVVKLASLSFTGDSEVVAAVSYGGTPVTPADDSALTGAVTAISDDLAALRGAVAASQVAGTVASGGTGTTTLRVTGLTSIAVANLPGMQCEAQLSGGLKARLPISAASDLGGGVYQLTFSPGFGSAIPAGYAVTIS